MLPTVDAPLELTHAGATTDGTFMYVAGGYPPRTVLVLTTPHGSARAEVTERDVWGNARVSGLDRPPFPVELLDG